MFEHACTDGSLSDTALGGTSEPEPASDDALLKAEPRDYFGSGMGKKSNSTSQLSATGESQNIRLSLRIISVAVLEVDSMTVQPLKIYVPLTSTVKLKV